MDFEYKKVLWKITCVSKSDSKKRNSIATSARHGHGIITKPPVFVDSSYSHRQNNGAIIKVGWSLSIISDWLPWRELVDNFRLAAMAAIAGAC